MVSHLFFYQFTLIALIWLCVMLQWVWPSAPPPRARPPWPPHPHGRSERRAPKPFAGFTQKAALRRL